MNIKVPIHIRNAFSCLFTHMIYKHIGREVQNSVDKSCNVSIRDVSGGAEITVLKKYNTQ